MDLFDIAKEYLKLDQNPITNAHIKLLVDEKDTVSLNKLLSSRLTFGTAGLRAEMGSGYSRMNELTVIQASQGLCAYYLEIIPDFKSRGVVIGHDHRHNSDSFARLTAAVFLAKGVKVYYYPDLVHTPLVPYGVTHFNAGCGIMITASHNPKQDNGYKVYAGNGCQIISPHDKEIADRIMKNLIPWTWDYKLVETSSLVTNPTSIIDKYFEKLASMSHFGLQNNTQNVKFCYTAMHGVGLSFAQRSFKAFNLIDFYPTPEQMYPDPEFPTVKFPNPEEGEGALALAMENASRNDCAIILANDPDADRLAIAEFQKSSGKWHIFTGNQIGVILASFILQSYKEKNNGVLDPSLSLVTTTVSSHMLQEMAKVEGIKFDETLTGFKWLGNKAIDLGEKGFNTVFAFEEAIGFMCYDAVRDKDGVSALGVFSEWANHLYGQGKTVYEHLTSLYEKYGYWVSNNAYFICHDKQVINAIFDKIRYGANPIPDDGSYPYKLAYPEEINGVKVVSVRDLTIGYDSSTSDHKPTLPVSASSQMLTFRLANDCLMTLRTSGTEPKIKYYTEYKGSSLEQGRTELDAMVKSMIDICLEPVLNNLQ